jgi:hypothetical protein
VPRLGPSHMLAAFVSTAGISIRAPDSSFALVSLTVSSMPLQWRLSTPRRSHLERAAR